MADPYDTGYKVGQKNSKRPMTNLPENADITCAIHWKSLRAAMPKSGIAAVFPTEEACRSRFEEVRWPNGPTCPRCGGDQFTHLNTRGVRQCFDCRYQYTATAQTSLHRTRLGMLQWFLAAEAVILHRDLFLGRQDIPAHDLAGVIGVSYVTARRVRAVVEDDLAQGGAGLLKFAICIVKQTPPDGVYLGSLEHLHWLNGLQ